MNVLLPYLHIFGNENRLSDEKTCDRVWIFISLKEGKQFFLHFMRLLQGEWRVWFMDTLSPCLGKPYSYTNWSILKLITNTVHVMVILLFHKYLQLHTHIYSKTCTFRLCLMQNLVLSYLCVFPQSIKIIPCRNPAGLGAERERATANGTL